MKGNTRIVLGALLVAGGFGFTAPSHAQATSAITLLNDYNVITGSFTGGCCDTQGNILANSANISGSPQIGGSGHGPVLSSALTVATTLTGSGTLKVNGLLVGGNVSGISIQPNNGNLPLVVGGSLTNGAQFVNLNGVSASTGVAGASASASGLYSTAMTTLSNYSTQLSGMSQNGTVTQTASDQYTFSGKSVSGKVVVFDVSASIFGNGSTKEDLTFSLNSGQEAIINVIGSNTSNLTINANANGLGGDAIWNFSSIANISFNGGFSGDILATGANVVQGGSVLDGTIVAKSLVQGAELDYASTPSLVSPVPLPGSLVLFASALAGIGGVAGLRRRK